MNVACGAHGVLCHAVRQVGGTGVTTCLAILTAGLWLTACYDEPHTCSGSRVCLLTVGSLAVLTQVRYIGVSNETSYGVSEFIHAAKSAGLPRIQTIQNCECAAPPTGVLESPSEPTPPPTAVCVVSTLVSCAHLSSVGFHLRCCCCCCCALRPPPLLFAAAGYHLLQRSNYETDLAETCRRHNVSLLAYSPLAGE